MLLGEALYSFLSADDNVIALVEDRIYPAQNAEIGQLPCIVYQQISGPRAHSLQGASACAHPRMQLNCFAATYLEAKQLADAVRKAIDGYKGIWLTLDIYGVILLNELDVYEDDPQIHRVILDFKIWHYEAKT